MSDDRNSDSDTRVCGAYTHIVPTSTSHPSSDIHLPTNSTITYDTFVRAGIKCTSAFVRPESEQEPSSVTAATCSRGVRIVPDTTLEELNVSSRAALISELIVCSLIRSLHISSLATRTQAGKDFRCIRRSRWFGGSRDDQPKLKGAGFTEECV